MLAPLLSLNPELKVGHSPSDSCRAGSSARGNPEISWFGIPAWFDPFKDSQCHHAALPPEVKVLKVSMLLAVKDNAGVMRLD